MTSTTKTYSVIVKKSMSSDFVALFQYVNNASRKINSLKDNNYYLKFSLKLIIQMHISILQMSFCNMMLTNEPIIFPSNLIFYIVITVQPVVPTAL